MLQWDYRCAYCQVQLADKQATLDHIVPKATGGLTVRENLIPACLRCNVSKSAREWKEWLREQAFHSIERETAIRDWLSA